MLHKTHIEAQKQLCALEVVYICSLSFAARHFLSLLNARIGARRRIKQTAEERQEEKEEKKEDNKIKKKKI